MHNRDVVLSEAGRKWEVLHTHTLTSTHAHRVTVIAERRLFRMSPLSAGQARIRVINTSLGIRSHNSLELFLFCSHGNTRGSAQWERTVDVGHCVMRNWLTYWIFCFLFFNVLIKFTYFASSWRSSWTECWLLVYVPLLGVFRIII